MLEMCGEQEKTIKQLKYELNVIKQDRENEIETHTHQVQFNTKRVMILV